MTDDRWEMECDDAEFGRAGRSAGWTLLTYTLAFLICVLFWAAAFRGVMVWLGWAC